MEAINYDLEFSKSKKSNPTELSVIVKITDEKFIDRLDISKSKSRNKFLGDLKTKFPGLDGAADAIDSAMQDHAAKLLSTDDDDDDEVVTPIEKSKQELEKSHPDLIKKAEIFLKNPNLMSLTLDHISRLGVVGECDLVCGLYLIFTSRLLPSPLAAAILGESSSGKSYPINRVGSLFPPETKLQAHRLTPTALNYLKAGSLIHRAVIGGERSRAKDDGQADATRQLREMLSDGILRIAVTQKDARGNLTTQHIEQEGPISYCESTTLGSTEIFNEDKTRFILFCADETENQTRRIMERQAQDATELGNPDHIKSICSLHHAAQRLLDPVSVTIPFASDLISYIPHKRPESRRAFNHLLNLIKASALFHQYQRKRDGDAVVADIADYAIVQKYLSDAIGRGLGVTLTAGADRLWELIQDRYDFDDEFSTHDLKEISGLDWGVYSRIKELRKHGLVELVDVSHGSSSATYKMVPIPMKSSLELPEPEKIGGELCRLI